MNPDQAVELARHLIMQAIILSFPVLLAGAMISLVLSLLQTLTGIQDQTLTSVPRLMIVFAAGAVSMPWFLKRLVVYTCALWTDFHRFLI